ncbi:unnamed protein product [Caenorhabditis bovis]|uniref:UNC93-like protein MFSD11 n=1 Tax=Caenorhabditis bovis TaxID=2654633 RepID=A0A8S1EW20_9PELO|nr:unnamed protein product [Caenorhabditis bovis]
MIEKATFNVWQLGIWFFFNFFAFNSQGFIEEVVINSASASQKINSHAGYYSLAIIYAVFTVANFVAAPIVDILSPKWAMVFGALCYAAFQAGFFFLNEIYLYISSAILGFGAAIIWTGQGSYLSQNCTKDTTSRNSALLWGIGESSLIGGGIFLCAMFGTTSAARLTPKTIKILYGVFTVLAITSACIFACLRSPVYPEVKDNDSSGELISGTFKLMTTKKMLLLSVVFSYTGIELSFWSAIYPTCISFTRRLGTNTNFLLALNMITSGCGQVTAGLLFGVLGEKLRKIRRDYVVLLGAAIHLLAFGLCYTNFPTEASLKQSDDTGAIFTPIISIALIIGFLLGFGDAAWNTQLYSYICDVFTDKSSQAFAVFRFYQSALSCAAFFYSPVVHLHWHLSILSMTAILASVIFFIAESIERNNESSSDSAEVSSLKENKNSSKENDKNSKESAGESVKSVKSERSDTEV